MEFDLQRFMNINQRALMWAAFFGILILLHDFFAVMFLTFIFGFVMRKVAGWIRSATRAPHWLAVTGPYLVAVGLLVLLMTTAVPRVVDEGAQFSRDVPKLLRTLAREVKATATRYGLEPVLAKYVKAEPLGPPAASNGQTPRTAPAGSPVTEPVTPPSPLDPPPDAREAGEEDSAVVEAVAARLQGLMVQFFSGLVSPKGNPTLEHIFFEFVLSVAAGTLKFLLAILLSFLIVLDYDRITDELMKWRESRVGRFFQEAAASVVQFSGFVGWAFQCQLVVALLNAAITSIGLVVLGIEPLLLLTTIVFLFGLIPVLGVFISSVPIILIAFNKGALALALAALGVIVIVHLLEAYVFNPRIYAARFHLNPVIVLIILLVAHELFGVWGMLLGIPVTHYVLNVAQMPTRPRRRRRREREAPSPA